MGIKCFLIEPVFRAQRYLRRYIGDSKCPGPMSYHDAMVPFDVVGERLSDEVPKHWILEDGLPEPERDSSLWPEKCSCGFVFGDAGEFQVFSISIYKRENGEEFSLRDAPVGAIWDAFWLHGIDRGPDGKSLICRLPGRHDWIIDGPASNCTRPNDSTHKCWVRHGVPPNLTVDKNGNTCSAGAGSILVPGWHGFLRDGELVVA